MHTMIIGAVLYFGAQQFTSREVVIENTQVIDEEDALIDEPFEEEQVPAEPADEIEQTEVLENEAATAEESQAPVIDETPIEVEVIRSFTDPVETPAAPVEVPSGPPPIGDGAPRAAIAPIARPSDLGDTQVAVTENAPQTETESENEQAEIDAILSELVDEVETVGDQIGNNFVGSLQDAGVQLAALPPSRPQDLGVQLADAPNNSLENSEDVQGAQEEAISNTGAQLEAEVQTSTEQSEAIAPSISAQVPPARGALRTEVASALNQVQEVVEQTIDDLVEEVVNEDGEAAAILNSLLQESSNDQEGVVNQESEVVSSPESSQSNNSSDEGSAFAPRSAIAPPSRLTL